jgi:hypothetical protein
MAVAWLKPALGAAALAVAFGAGWAVNGWRLEEGFQSERLEQALNSHAIITERTKERDEAQAELQAERDDDARIAKGHQDETNALRAAVASRDRRLRIGATCTGSGVPPAGAASGVGAGGTAELDRDAESAYFAHRAAIDEARRITRGCQTELRKWAGLPPAPSQPAQ